MNQVGVKHDDGKLWAGTVLAGFWCETIRESFCDRLTATGEFSNADAARWRDVLHALFEAHLPVVTRLDDARLTIERVGLLPDALVRATRVGTYGARKYERDNWLHVDDGINRYYEAAGRHVLQILEGKWIDKPDDADDPGSGLANLDHICWCIFAGAKLADKAAV